jgi:hypothetical protein
LTWKQTVVGIQPDVGPLLHRFGEQMRSESARQGGRNSIFEEEPDVASTPRSRSFERGGEAQATAALEECRSIPLPAGLVEVDCQQEAGLIEQERVDSCDEWLSTVIMAGQVPANDVVGNGKEPTMGTYRALDSRLLADAAHPFVRAGRSVPGLPGLPALESARINVRAAAEE